MRVHIPCLFPKVGTIPNLVVGPDERHRTRSPVGFHLILYQNILIQPCAVNDLWQIVAWLNSAGLPLVARVHWPRSGQLFTFSPALAVRLKRVIFGTDRG